MRERERERELEQCEVQYLHNLFYFWNIKLEHVLYSSLESQRGTGTAGTRPLHAKITHHLLYKYKNHFMKCTGLYI